MAEVNFFDQALDEDLEFAVIVARHRGKWLLCRPGTGDAWQLPGGRRTPGERIHAAARRILWEKTGATEFQLEPISACGVTGPTLWNPVGETVYGGLFFAEVDEYAAPPVDAERAETGLFDRAPEEMTDPELQSRLLGCVQDWLDMGNFRSESANLFELLF